MQIKKTLIFWHRGKSHYLKLALDRDLTEKIMLYYLEINRINNFVGIGLIWTSSLDKLNECLKYYKHLSLNNEVFKRHFYLYELCKRENIEESIMCDSDLLIYDDLDKVSDRIILTFSADKMIMENWMSSFTSLFCMDL